MRLLALAATAKAYSQQLLFWLVLPLSSASFTLRWPCEDHTFAFSRIFSSRLSLFALSYRHLRVANLLKWLFQLLALAFGYCLYCLIMRMCKHLLLGSGDLLQNRFDFQNKLHYWPLMHLSSQPLPSAVALHLWSFPCELLPSSIEHASSLELLLIFPSKQERSELITQQAKSSSPF